MSTGDLERKRERTNAEAAETDARMASDCSSRRRQRSSTADPGPAVLAAALDIRGAVLRSLLTNTVLPVPKRGGTWAEERLQIKLVIPRLGRGYGDAMADGHAYWEWRDLMLLHPGGRARGGEKCVKCGEPVPPNAHWKHRDRHVCGTRCNGNLNRQFNRRMRAGAETDMHGRESVGPTPLANPRQSGKRVFKTLHGHTPPFEWEGFGVRTGDLVERYGVVVGYGLGHRAESESWPNWWPDHVLIAVEPVTGHRAMWGADADGNLTQTCLLYMGADNKLTYDPTFILGDKQCRWHRESVSTCTEDGREYEWEALVAAPEDSPYEPRWWTPERTALSEKRKRESSSLARHARRIRELAATKERFDPLEVYERDGWVCGMCLEPVDRALSWPDPKSPSLDHVIPLAANGDHSRANTQLAHWICNVRKGARMAEIEVLGRVVSDA